MGITISKGSAKFKYGWDKAEDLLNWLHSNPGLVGVSFVGRSNVGKSSIINTLFGRGTARVSKTPGRTREINVFEFKLAKNGKPMDDLPPMFLFDLPGYGHAEVSKSMAKNWEALMGTFFTYAPRSVSMVNLQDARHPDQKADKEFHKFLKDYDFETILAFNKIDKLKKQKERAALNKLKPQLYAAYKWVKQIFFVSAESRQGVDELEYAISSFLLNELDRRDGNTAD